MKFRVEHVIDKIDLPAFETLYFDEAFNIALCATLKLERQLISLDRREGRIVRVVKIGPERPIPAPVAKLLGAQRIEYTEHVDYRLGSNQGTWRSVSSLITDKVESAGSFSFVARMGGVARIVDGDVKVKVFGIGGVIERFITADVEQSYDNAAAFTQTWVNQHPTA